MPSRDAEKSRGASRLTRRAALKGLAASFAIGLAGRASAADALSFGLTPLFLDSDIELLAMIEQYLRGRLLMPVQLVKRRTYQEITAMLLTGQLDAAWICDDPYVQYKDRLTALAVPLYRKQPLYQTYVVVNEQCPAQTFDEIKGTVHAFSDPDSTSGYLVTRYLLALRHTTPAAFFRDSFFTYGHRNVVRAVATGLAQSGSIDGYVWDVMHEREPELVKTTRIVYRSEEMGFPPIAGLKSAHDSLKSKAFSAAMLDMPSDELGRNILDRLALDGFTKETEHLYDSTLEKWLVVKEQA